MSSDDPTSAIVDPTALVSERSEVPDRIEDPQADLATALSFEDRYQVRTLLGRGGMGEVLLVRDRRIGRDVALKLMRKSAQADEEMRRRFVREACVQGQLEHPAFVPVYELGTNSSAEAFFTMKRVRGVTLMEILRGSAAGDGEIRAKYSRNKLLAIYLDVCQAIDFAHSMGVIHRDLKPSNVMIGDFGEVYVIDWGLAGIDPRTPSNVGAQNSLAELIGGTPGYMAPEQTFSNRAPDPKLDVFSLGAILFEILTLERLDPNAAKRSITDPHPQIERRPSNRTPERDIPPELDEIVVRATQYDPSQRTRTVREISVAIERFLDGDRDLELRQRIADGHSLKGRLLVEQALEREGPEEEQLRAAAMRELGRALALEPQNQEAAAAMARLLLEPPKRIPSEARAQGEQEHQRSRRTAAKGGSIGSLSTLIFAIPILLMGVHDAAPLVLSAAALLAMSASSLFAMSSKRLLPRHRNFSLLFGLIALVAATRILGPMFLVPGLAMAMILPFVMNGRPSDRPAIMILGCLTFVGPFTLERAGLIPASYSFEAGKMCILPMATALPEGPTLLLLLISGLAPLLVSNFMALRLHNSLARAEERLRVQSWHLTQLAPMSREASKP